MLYLSTSMIRRNKKTIEANDMEKTLLSTAIVLLSLTCWAQTYTPLDAASSVKFKIKNFGLQTEGSFKGLKGIVVFNAAGLTKAYIDVSVDAATIDTGTKLRDNNLRSEDYFDVKNFTTLRFKSVKIEAGKSPGTFVVIGDLTIKRTTRQIALPFEAVQGKDGYQLKGVFAINRRDFSVGKSSVAMADDVIVELSVMLVRQTGVSGN